MAMTRKKALAASETRIVSRSRIRMNPYNPKRHSEERVKLQRNNLKKVGYLGGIVWNETTGNLIDGHRRIKAMDLYYGYDGTPETDYDVKVEVVRMDEALEKQQLAYMSAGDTSPDIDLLANIADGIDFSEIGMPQSEVDEILNIANGGDVEAPDYFAELLTPTKPVAEKGSPEYEEAKARVKDGKSRTRDVEHRDTLNDAALITLSFSDNANLTAFCDLLGIEPGARFCKGEDVLRMIE